MTAALILIAVRQVECQVEKKKSLDDDLDECMDNLNLHKAHNKNNPSNVIFEFS